MADLVSHSNVSTRLDNLMRQTLMLSDPNDPGEVARALARRFRGGAARLESDRTGLPAQVISLAAAPAEFASPSTAELIQARDDLERDLASLVSAPQLKDIRPELQGWQRALPEILERGANSARQSIHEGHRATAMAVRQELGDYARLARLLGATTPEFNGAYRSLAKSLDEGAAMMVVLAGEAIAGRGFGGIAALPSPVADLSMRRDAVLEALRDLLHPGTGDNDDNRWPRGLHALNRIEDWLQQSGQGHLRALLDENYLAPLLDKLVESAGHSDAALLRGLGATATVTLAQINRLVDMLGRAVNPTSPPLARFRQALSLFARSFRADRGRRLILAARPPLLSYGLYGLSNDPGDKRLTEIMVRRGEIAAMLDCFLGCGCSADKVACQVLLDKLLYDIDRAIDRYLQDPTAINSEAERRAAAFGLLIRVVIDAKAVASELDKGSAYFVNPANSSVEKAAPHIRRLKGCFPSGSSSSDKFQRETAATQEEGSDPLIERLETALDSVYRKLVEPLGGGDRDTLSAAAKSDMRAELCAQERDEARWFEFARAMTPGCVELDRLQAIVSAVIAGGLYLSGSAPQRRDDDLQVYGCTADVDNLPATIATSLDSFAYRFLTRDGQIDPTFDPEE
ncbi:hypothetical protein [Poseidonocella sp. HB161398]|uniref:hypothetical protein n=1 Tax=Poseidonocella sp. HB161398 TaxID=2320855 RepID=UPI001108079D|nr:hypothetical protein [Poseidonocella sp. HB161398]